MNVISLVVGVLMLLATVSGLIWAWFSMSQIEADLRAFPVFDRLDFEV